MTLLPTSMTFCILELTLCGHMPPSAFVTWRCTLRRSRRRRIFASTQHLDLSAPYRVCAAVEREVRLSQQAVLNPCISLNPTHKVVLQRLVSHLTRRTRIAIAVQLQTSQSTRLAVASGVMRVSDSQSLYPRPMTPSHCTLGQ